MVLTKNGSPNPKGVPPSPKTKKCNFTWATLYMLLTSQKFPHNISYTEDKNNALLSPDPSQVPKLSNALFSVFVQSGIHSEFFGAERAPKIP